MNASYWSLHGGCWEPAPGVPDALATPWSVQGLPVPDLPHPASAAEVLRLPSRGALLVGTVPGQREQAERPASV